MSDEDRQSPVRRARRAKDAAERSRPLDGGAIALGMICALAAFVPAVVFVLPVWATAGLVVTGLFVGGFIAARFTPQRGCAVCHAGVVGLTFYTVVAAIVASTYLAPAEPPTDTVFGTGEPPTQGLVETIMLDVRLLGAVAVLGLVLAAVGGWVATIEPS